MPLRRAWALYLAMTVPFGIAVHLVSEFAGLGRDADDVAFSPLHGYLALIALASAVVFVVASGIVRGPSERRRRLALLSSALPWRGRGPAFVGLSAAMQFAFFAVTQLGEGCPLCHGDVLVGVVAALFASLAGALLLGALRSRASHVLDAVCAIVRDASAPQILASALRRPERLIATFIVALPTIGGNRPPPLLS